MEEYDFKKIEAKWQNRWEKEKYGEAPDFSDKPKHYHLVEFPYPSGEGLHVGHCMGYGASDAYCRMKRMQGANVMFPMGWDAFGLPTENYAIKMKVKPQEITNQAVVNFKKQMKTLGYSFDWSREINTTDPNYYKWTQWIFLQFYKHGVVDGKLMEIADDNKTTPRLAFQAEMPVNWCPSCKIVLANEEVVAGSCERCGAHTEKRKQKQWMLRITAYADRLIEDLKTVDYEERIKTQQINWIGKSIGTDIDFKIAVSPLAPRNDIIRVFTTRADTLFGCTYVVLAPEHPLIENIKYQISNVKGVEDYIIKAKSKSDLERTELEKDKTGVKLEGVKAINPINNEEVDIFVADYVLASYGTGAVMAVPAHDDRDFEFAKKYNLPLKEVIIPKTIDPIDPPKDDVKTVFRNAVQVILINPKDNKVLCLKWKKFPWTTFVTGGIDEGEEIIEAAKREVLEETGYKNIKYVKTLGGPVESNFYANHKQENRKAMFTALVFELKNNEQIDITAEEKNTHDIHWVSWEEFDKDKNVKCSEYSIWVDRFFNPEHAFIDYGVLINSGEFDGLDSKTAQQKITEKLKQDGNGDFSVNFKLRDWIFSRQHYWGEPIPIIYCRKCWEILNSKSKILNKDEITIIDGKEYMKVPVPEKELPVKLPDVDNYEPTDTGESPLAKIDSWVNVKCPICGSDAKRETDTMPNWAGSSWYFIAYALNQNSKIKNQNDGNIFIDNKKQLDYWFPIDLYNGGMEHTTLHLLYSRFWHKFLYDLNVVSGPEPYAKRIAHGIILGPDGQKMSKSKGNVINPDEMVQQFGADTLRAYIMFIGPYTQESAWNMSGIMGVHRFLKRVWQNQNKIHPVKSGEAGSQSEISQGKDTNDTTELLVKLNQTIKGVTEDLENYQINTVVSKLMELNNVIEKEKSISKDSYKIFLQLLCPACPHIASELWKRLKFDDDISDSVWPKPEKKYLVAEEIEIAIQINGKTRQIIEIKTDASQTKVEKIALADDKIKNIIGGKEIKKTIYVAGRIVNFVIE